MNITQEYKDIVEYYYENITPDKKYRYDEDRGSYFYYDEGLDMWFEHSGSDIVLGMKPYYDKR